jgi:hypothetical protein
MPIHIQSTCFRISVSFILPNIKINYMNKIFFRSSALCVVAGAMILGTGYLLRTDIDKKYIDEFANNQGFVSSILVAVGSLLFLFGLPGLFAAQKLHSSKTGIIASAFAFMGMAAFHLGTLALYFVTPVLVTHNAATRALLYSDEPPFPGFAIFWAISLLVQVIGLCWIGIKTWKNSSNFKLDVLLMLGGALIFLTAPFIYFPLIKPANTLVMLGFVLSAVSILRSKTEKIPFKLKTSMGA